MWVGDCDCVVVHLFVWMSIYLPIYLFRKIAHRIQYYCSRESTKFACQFHKLWIASIQFVTYTLQFASMEHTGKDSLDFECLACRITTNDEDRIHFHALGKVLMCTCRLYKLLS